MYHTFHFLMQDTLVCCFLFPLPLPVGHYRGEGILIWGLMFLPVTDFKAFPHAPASPLVSEQFLAVNVWCVFFCLVCLFFLFVPVIQSLAASPPCEI